MNIGSKVICINDKFESWTKEFYNQYPVRGEIYTIRDMRIGMDKNGKQTPSVLLEEIKNPKFENKEVAFSLFRFAEFIVY